jgi:hypothetical protein
MLHGSSRWRRESREAPNSLLASFRLQPIKSEACDRWPSVILRTEALGSVVQEVHPISPYAQNAVARCCCRLPCNESLESCTLLVSSVAVICCPVRYTVCSLFKQVFQYHLISPLLTEEASHKHRSSLGACPTADARSRASEINASLRLRQCTRLPARRLPPRNASATLLLLLTQTPTRTFSPTHQLCICILLDQTSQTSSPPSCIFTPTLTRPQTSLCHPIAAPTTTHSHTPQQHETSTQPQRACLAKGCCLQRNTKGLDPPHHLLAQLLQPPPAVYHNGSLLLLRRRR